MPLNALGLGFTFYAEDKATAVLDALHSKLRGVKQEAKETQEALKFKAQAGGGGGGGGPAPPRQGGGRGFLQGLSPLASGGFGLFSGAANLAMGVGRFGAGALATRVLQRQMVARLGASQFGGAFMKGPGAAAEFEAELANLSGITGIDKHSEAFKKLREHAIQAGIDTKFTAVESVQALRSIMQTGKSAQQAMELLYPTLDLAAASFGKMSPEKAAQTLGVVMNQFEVDAKSAADKIVRIAQTSSFQVHELKNFLTNAGTVAKQFKVSFDDMLILGAAGRAMGNIPSKTGTQLQQMLTRMFTGGKPTKLLEQTLGAGNAQFDAKGNIKNAGDALVRLGLVLDRMSDKKRLETMQKIFGQVGIRSAAAFFNAEREITDKQGNTRKVRTGEWLAWQREQLANAQGTAEKFRDVLRDTFKGWSEMISSSLESIAIAFGMQFTKNLGAAAKAISEVLDFVGKMVREIPDATKKSIANFTSVALGLMTILFSVHQVRLGIGLIIPLIFRMGTSLLVLIALTPLLVGIGLALWGIYEALNGVAQGTGNAISGFFGRVGLFFKGFFSLLHSGSITGELKKLADGSTKFTGLLAEFYKTPENRAVLDFLVSFWMAFTRIRNAVQGFVHGAWAQFNNPATGAAWERLKESFVKLGLALGLIKPGQVDSLLKADTASFFARGVEAGAKAVELLVKGLEWLTKKIDWASTVDWSKTFSETWEIVKTTVVVVAGFFYAIYRVAKFLAGFVFRFFGGEGDKEATLMERIEKASTAFVAAFALLAGIKFALIAAGIASIAAAGAPLIAIAGAMAYMALKAPSLEKSFDKEQKANIKKGNYSWFDRLEDKVSSSKWSPAGIADRVLGTNFRGKAEERLKMHETATTVTATPLGERGYTTITSDKTGQSPTPGVDALSRLSAATQDVTTNAGAMFDIKALQTQVEQLVTQIPGAIKEGFDNVQIPVHLDGDKIGERSHAFMSDHDVSSLNPNSTQLASGFHTPSK
jgi:TP901 family phage tail tape measure protein